MKNTQKTIMFFIFLLGSIVIGSLVAYLTKDIAFLSWLSYGKTFGINNANPTTIDMGVLQLTFGVGIELNVAVIIFITIGMLIYGRFYGRR